MRQGQLTQCRAARGCQANPDLAFIDRAGTAYDGAGVLQAVDQFDGAVMLNVEARGDLANSGLDVLRKPMYRQQELMLLRLDAVFLGGGFAEVEKSPDLPAELGEFAVLFAAEVAAGVLSCPHSYIVSRYKWRARQFGKWFGKRRGAMREALNFTLTQGRKKRQRFANLEEPGQP